MCKECKETQDIMRELASDMHDMFRENRKENERHHDEMFTRIRGVEIQQAEAKGNKQGIIFSFTLFWSIVIAAIGGLIGYFSK